MDPVPFTIASAVALGLIAAIGALWRSHVVDKRESRQREADNNRRCEKQNDAAIARIQHLEERSHGEQHELLTKCMDALNTNARAFERLVDLETSRHTKSGAHPTVGG